MNEITTPPLHRVAAFCVRGASVRTNNAKEATECGQIPSLWAAFWAAHAGAQQAVYGVYSDYESDASGDYRLTVGVATSADAGGHFAGAAADQMQVQIEGGLYLVFTAEGEMPAAVLAAWQAVWAHFSPENAAALPYRRRYATDFEHYTGVGAAALYIGIEMQGQAVCEPTKL